MRVTPALRYTQAMARRLDYEKKKAPRDAIQIGVDDDSPMPFWRVRKQVRSRLIMQRPDLSPDEIERRVQRIVNRGLRPAA